jgi:cytochrome P450
MRITAPAPDARVDLAGIDFADPHLYAGGDAHLAWQTAAGRTPGVPQPNPAPGFWVVTRHHDVRRVLRDHDTFTSERGIVLMSLGVPDPAAGKMVAVTDPPRHHELREPMGKPLSRLAVAAHAGWIRRLVRETVAPAWDCDVWDVATAFAPLPVAIVVRLMGLPHDDVQTLQRWAYAAVAPLDPHCRTGPGTARWSAPITRS